MFGGNSNWRGPVWFPLNYLACDAIERLGRFYGDDVRSSSTRPARGTEHTLVDVATDLRRRLIALFLLDEHGRRPCFGGAAKFDDPRWRDNVLFNEYFDGDTGKGLGASHQTGWTGLVADMLLRVHGIGPGHRTRPGDEVR